MSALAYRLAWAAAAVLALGAVIHLALARPSNRLWDGLVARTPDVGQEGRRFDALEGEAEDVARREAARRIVVQAVIDGRLSLAEAADRFQEIDLASETFHWERFRAYWPGATDEEKQSRAVLCHVRVALANDPEAARDVARRLEAELQALLESCAPRPRPSPCPPPNRPVPAGTDQLRGS